MDTARARARAVLRLRGRAVAAAALPAACAAVLLVGRFTGRIGAAGSPDAPLWDGIRWAVGAVAALTLLLAALVARSHRRAVPPVTPAVPLTRADAPELYRLIEELADRLEVPAPAAIALTPDCDSWLEEPHRRGRAEPGAPVLVIGSPFLWWMRAGELRALLAPVVAGTAAAADPEIAAARRWIRTLDAALGDRHRGPAALVDRVNRRLLGGCREHSAELEHAVAAWASEQAKAVDYGLRIAAQQQVGLAYAGWDRLLTRVALPAWRLGRHPSHLNAGVVAALTELSRRDRLADGYENRLGDRPACDLLEEPGLIDTRVSLLAAELLHEEPAGGWQQLDWEDYPEQVVDRGWRESAAALQAALGDDRPHTGPALDKLLARLAAGEAEALAAALAGRVARAAEVAPPLPPVRGGRDLLVEHLTATVCCAAVDAGTASPGLDWLDGPVLLSRAAPRAELAPAVAAAAEAGQDGPLRAWLERAGARLERPVRLSG
ncbi:membrane protein [Kitasatospora cheerisanensis KCTC 2395]|uniref:Membrane protein n=1 Tax=Kitasatospora cheerisanensis KCTC 2395 TaxID=1348663 RepID=A0A066YSA4_9ACTN|nr:membrane protein [Kitasatospora cheerisanensis KCTC 2395]